MDGSVEQRADAALDRIEDAILRIEAAIATGRGPDPDEGEVERLRQAHFMLRSRVEAAIGEIDALLAEPQEAA